MDKKLKSKIIKEFQNDPGCNIKALARKYDIPYATLYIMLRRNHLDTTPSSRKKAIKESIVFDAKNDPSITRNMLAEKYGVKPDAVSYILKTNGIKVKREGRPREMSDSTKEMIDYAKSHPKMTFKEIGDRFGISRQRVHQIYKKHVAPEKELRGISRERQEAIEKRENSLKAFRDYLDNIDGSVPSYKELMSRFHISPNIICQEVKSRNLEYTFSINRRKTAEEKREFIKNNRDHMTVKQISEALGVSPATVYHHQHKLRQSGKI